MSSVSIIFCMLSIPFNSCNGDVKWQGSGKCHTELAKGKTGNGRYIPTCLSICHWTLLIVTAKVILVCYCLMHNLEGTVWSDGDNLMRTVFLEQVTPPAMWCLTSLLRSHTATNRSQGKLFQVLPMASRTGSTNTIYNSLFLLRTIIWDRINENKGECHQCRIISFLKIPILKRSDWYSVIMISQTNLTVLIFIYMILIMLRGHKHVTEGRHSQDYRLLSLHVFSLFLYHSC